MNTYEPRRHHATALLTVALLALTLPMPAAMSAEPATKTEPSRDAIQQKLEAAQKRLDAAAREVADLSMSLSDDVMPEMMAFAGMSSQSAVLGVNIGSRRNSNRDDGVEILSVSPGGAAAEAGLKAGDVMTQVNGKPLKRDGDESPRSRLLAAMRDVEPEQKVAVKYVRDGKPATANLVAQPAVRRLFSAGMPFPPLPMGAVGGAMRGVEAIPDFAFMRADGVFGAAELVPLTPKLGQYFGVDKGLLVVRAPADARLKLEEGDVIVDIDGRVPSSPTHALRILGSYQAGEQLKLNVLRMKKRVAFDITIPEDKRGRFPEGKFERSMERSRFNVEPPEDIFFMQRPAVVATSPAQEAI